ncbi:MAG: D-alanine--D-alanine ligase [Saprospiraceae bacterium]|nr:D-alanine--D-alanine ligase [Saprospiraceae bacterium]
MIRVGLFFGGPSREREISFAGGRTVFDNLNKQLFEPVLYFIDSHRNLIELDWSYMYKGTIRDFYPPAQELPPSPHHFQIYLESLGDLTAEDVQRIAGSVGTLRQWTDLRDRIDIAFLALHGEFGEDGQIQGLLESLEIPYTGSGIRASAIGIDKGIQKKLMHAGGFPGPEHQVISRQAWIQGDPASFFAEARATFGNKLVIRPANQGSSIGVSIIDLHDVDTFKKAMDLAFFRWRLDASDWIQYSEEEQVNWVRQMNDIRSGSGFPLLLNGKQIFHPEALLDELRTGTASSWVLESVSAEHTVLLEGFIQGKEFSCIVIRREDGTAVALPPTEIIKGGEVFDYRSKYLPGLSRKETPIHLPDEKIQAIRSECERLFHFLDFQVYARIDGFILDDGTIFLNDPNTTSGMMPSSFFFHQAAEIGINPSQFLTYILRTSLQERLDHATAKPRWSGLLDQLDLALKQLHQQESDQKRIAVILGGYSTERHISVESGRNIYEKLSSSAKYEPIPVFLTGRPGQHQLHIIPVNLLLKDNADDIHDRLTNWVVHPVIEQIKGQCREVTRKYAYADATFKPRPITYETLAQEVDGVFIALHGRPGEDGEVQENLERVGLPYNGSDVQSSRITIDKYRTLHLLAEQGFPVARQYLAMRSLWESDRQAWVDELEAIFTYPFIGKPVDDGCSSAVKVIKNRAALEAFAGALYRAEEAVPADMILALGLKPKEEFPRKEQILFETLISREGTRHFLEVTGGLVTHWQDSEWIYEVFEPSEALAGSEILSLEEKFLAGEGQNITPARFSSDPQEAARISALVRKDLERAARILGVRGYARIDAFVKIFEDGRVETWIIEVNSLPGMTPATCIFHQAAINGYTPYHFIDQILEFSFHERTSSQLI